MSKSLRHISATYVRIDQGVILNNELLRKASSCPKLIRVNFFRRCHLLPANTNLSEYDSLHRCSRER